MYSVYILYSQKVNKLYVGFSADLKKRIEDYKKGRDRVTQTWLPLMFIYAEMYASKKDALRREKFFKSGWGKQYVHKILASTIKKVKSSKI